MAQHIQIRRDTAANWTAANPVLAVGELGIETDTLKMKVGDGVTAWNDLGYIDLGGDLDTTGTPATDEFARFTDADTLEGLSAAEVRTALNVEDGATADQSDAQIATAYGNEVEQVSGGEITAGTETALRTYSPADVVSIVAAHESGGGGGGGPAALVVKTADETVNNSDTLQADDHLFFTASANTTYLLRFTMVGDIGSGPDAMVDLDLPSGSGYLMCGENNEYEAIGTGGLRFNGGGGVRGSSAINAVIDIGGTGGTVTVLWAQRSATVEDTIIKEGNSLIAWEV